jgi:hypothetical protein
MHLANNPHYLVPSINSHEITAQAEKNKIDVIMPVSSGLRILDTIRSSLTVDSILSTSDMAYAKEGKSFNTYEKEFGDTDGPFYLGLVATDTYNNIVSNLVVYSTEAMFDESTLTYGNADILSGTIGFLSGEMASLSITAKSVIPEMILLTQQQALFWGAVIIIILPVFILIVGAMVSLKRRKR